MTQTTTTGTFTEAQQQAITHRDGPLLVLAAAGSGKTLVITRRILNLLNQGIPPWQILALTFTNKAAAEMRDRVAALLKLDKTTPKDITISTFHSFCARVVRRYAEQVNLTSDYTIYSTSDQKSAMKEAVIQADLSTSNFPPDRMLSLVSQAKNRLQGPEDMQAEAMDFWSKKAAICYKLYTKILRSNNAVDFDDLLLFTATLLRDHEEIRTRLQARFRYVLIDEYQDTNHAQFVISHTLAAAHRNICIVGDPDQSIYGWRGADISNILEFTKLYPDAPVIKLGENFRSTAPILKIADHLIKHNKLRKDKPLFTNSDGGELPIIQMCEDEHHEARAVCDYFEELNLEHGIPWRDMAVFYRTNALSRVIEAELRKRTIPYVIVRGTAFYDRLEIRHALAYLRVILNPNDDISLRRIVNTPPRGIGKTSLTKVDLHAAQNGLSLFDAMSRAEQISGLTNRAVSALTRFVELVRNWRGDGAFFGVEVTGELPELISRVIRESGLEAYYQKSGTDEDRERIANLNELVSSATDFEEDYASKIAAAAERQNIISGEDSEAADDLPFFFDDEEPEILVNGNEPSLLTKIRAYLETVALVADSDALDMDSGMIQLMTLHAAKGLEFPVVSIIGLEDGLLPHAMSRGEDSDLEEERRLFFVGITRAKEHLLITRAHIRTVRGMTEPTITSQFLRELPEQDVTWIGSECMSTPSIQTFDINADRQFAKNRFGRTQSSNSSSYSATHNSATGSAARQKSGISNTHQSIKPKQSSMYPVGSEVQHPQFGHGVIESVSRSGPHTRLIISFRGIGKKTLIAEYARLTSV